MVCGVRRSKQSGDSTQAEVRSCSIYEIDGRLLVRTLDRSDGLGIERDESTVLDGFPDLAPGAVGEAVGEALDRTVEVRRPASWRPSSECAQPLLAASPKRYRSYRAWQRAARQVSVHATLDKISVQRWHPDLSRNSWMPPADVGRPVEDWPQEIDLPASATPEEIGAAVLDVLRQPPVRDSS
jgi:hypothetical protein